VLGLLVLDVAGLNRLVVVLAASKAILGSPLGLFVSAFAETEFQAVQFMPAGQAARQGLHRRRAQGDR
jgi:ABC-2 type transport system permease protein